MSDKYDRVCGVTISTVFLGVDFSFGAGEKPMLFETIIFGRKDVVWQRRYSSYEEAEEGHRAVCEIVRRGEIGVLT